MERAQLEAVLRATGCAEERDGLIYLIDRKWSASDREQVDAIEAQSAAAAGGSELGWVCVPTGGTSGRVRFGRHDERTLGAAAEGFREHFGLTKVNAVDVLPAHHVSGLLARVRCAASGGCHLPWDWRRLAAGDRPALASGEWVVSLVPTQLQRLLTTPATVAWLRNFRVIFVGGGPVWPDLTDAAAAAGLRVSLSYGMTETAAMVAALDPADFLAGARDSGKSLPHAAITVDADGAIVVEGESVFRGYAPEFRGVRRFQTGDAGRIDSNGHVHVFGRRDAVIITGGEKVQPTEVEAALRSTGQFRDVAVVGVPDADWGEAVVACYPDDVHLPDLTKVRAAIEHQLSPHKRPKRYVAVAEWPRTEHGKLNRAKLRELSINR